MPPKEAEAHIVQAIKRLAGEPGDAAVTSTAEYDLMGEQLKVEDVCDALLDWIEKGKDIREIVTEKAKGHTGKPAFVIKPRLHGKIFYIKVAVTDPGGSRERLTIVSAHPDH